MSKDIHYLIDGHKKFHKRYFKVDTTLYQDLTKVGQKPKYLVIACSDSRVDPAIIMNCKPGDLFVIRNVANLVPPFEPDTHYHGTSAALEFGICTLNIRHVIILGHSQCGGIMALLKQLKALHLSKKVGGVLKKHKSKKGKPSVFLNKWLELAKPACNHVLSVYPNLSVKNQGNHCSKKSILYSLSNLNNFSWVRKRVKAKELFLHGWYFNLNNGNLSAYNAKKRKFEGLGYGDDEEGIF